jgi:hypothetical protein
MCDQRCATMAIRRGFHPLEYKSVTTYKEVRMRTIIAVAAAALVLAFTAHADEISRLPVPNTRLANSCATANSPVIRTAYTPDRTAKCAQFLATGNVLHARRWTRT